jgi:hypothetical protein
MSKAYKAETTVTPRSWKRSKLRGKKEEEKTWLVKL